MVSQLKGSQISIFVEEGFLAINEIFADIQTHKHKHNLLMSNEE